MATAYHDAVNGQPLTITINADAWAQPDTANWFTRCRELNRLLRKSTHLLHLPAAEGTETTWYAGVGGTSLAAGIERMALSEVALRKAIVVLPLDTRIYVANVQKGLIREEWVLYPDACDTRVQAWRNEGREFVLLTGGGRSTVDLPNAAELQVDIDTESMSFKYASVAFLANGLIRWRDCVAVCLVTLLTVGTSFAIAWWQRSPSIDPLQKVAALVTQPIAAAQFNASAELAKLALISAEHDADLWNVEGATDLNYKATVGEVELRFANSTLISTPIEPLPIVPDIAVLRPYTLATFKEKLEGYLVSPNWSLAFGDPYPIGAGKESEQQITISVGDAAVANVTSVAPALVDLSERLVRLPIALHEVNCSVGEGVVNYCELRLAIRGLSS